MYFHSLYFRFLHDFNFYMILILLNGFHVCFPFSIFMSICSRFYVSYSILKCVITVLIFFHHSMFCFVSPPQPYEAGPFLLIMGLSQPFAGSSNCRWCVNAIILFLWMDTCLFLYVFSVVPQSFPWIILPYNNHFIHCVVYILCFSVMV